MKKKKKKKTKKKCVKTANILNWSHEVCSERNRTTDYTKGGQKEKKKKKKKETGQVPFDTSDFLITSYFRFTSPTLDVPTSDFCIPISYF